MARITVTGRMGQVRTTGKNNEFISFGIAEPDYKDKSGNYVTPWFNFLIKADAPEGKFLLDNGAKMDVVTVGANINQSYDKESATTKYFLGSPRVDVITWKKANAGAQAAPAQKAAPAAQPAADAPWAQPDFAVDPDKLPF